MLRIASLLIVYLLQSVSANAEVKLAEVAGAPGAFDQSTSIVFHPLRREAFVANPGSGIVQKFVVDTGQVVGSLSLSPGIGPAALSPDGRSLVVLGVTAQRIYIIDAEAMTLRRETGYEFSGFTGANNILFSPESARFFLADPSRDQVVVINAADGQVVRFINVSVNPNILTPLPNGRAFAVLCSGREPEDEQRLVLIDMLTEAVYDDPRLLGFDTDSFNNVAFTVTGSHGFVPSFHDNRIFVYDLKTFQPGSRSSGGFGPTKVFSSPNGRIMAVINKGSNSVALLSLPEGLPITDQNDHPVAVSIPALEFSTDSTLAFSLDSHTLYVPSVRTNEIIAYDVENRRIRSRIPTGRGPSQVAVSPDGTVLASLDLGGNTVSLLAVNPRPLYVPHLTQTPTTYSGIAVANFGGQAENIVFVGRDDEGRNLPGATNPRLLTIAPGQQLALVAGQLFGLDPQSAYRGYIDAYTSGNGLTVLYLTGNIDQSQLDGFIADGMVGKQLGFARIIEGISNFGSQTSTEAILENPGEEDAHLTLRLFATRPLEGPGRILASQDMTLPAHGRIQRRISELLPSAPYPVEGGYLEVVADVPLKGLALLHLGDSLAAIPAIQRGLPDTTFVAAHFASGGAGTLDTPISSQLSLTNSTAAPMTVTASVTDAEGAIIPRRAKPFVRTLAPYETVSGDASKLFGFPDPLTDPALLQGTMQLEADSKGLLTDLLYGDARNGKYLTSASLHAQQSRRFALPHLAEGLFSGKGLYTGIAMHNPNGSQAQIVVEAFSPAGALLGRAIISLDRGARISRTLGQLIPSVTQQNGGTMTITSDIPISLFEVFGSTASEFLAAVPPVILEQ